MKDFKELRDMFKAIVEILDELVALEDAEKNGEEIDSDKIETLTGKFMYKMVILTSKLGG